METRSIITHEDMKKVDLMFEYQDVSVYRWSETTMNLRRFFTRWKDVSIFTSISPSISPSISSSISSSIIGTCTFCSKPGTKSHSKLDLVSCDKCYTIIETESFDSLEGTDSVSQWLYHTLYNIIYKEYGFVTGTDIYIEYDIAYDACYQCGKSIKNQEDDIVLYQGSDDFAVYHLKCHDKPERKQFYDLASYDSIIEELEHDIKN